MIKTKLVISLIIFTLLMISTSVIKNKTHVIEKNITRYQENISVLKKSLHESQLDYFYLTSPSYISEKIKEYSDATYIPMNYSKIYFSYEDFVKEMHKSAEITHEKKNNKK